MTYQLVIGAIAAYLLGSIPFGLLVMKFGGYGDIRRIGSGNIGATNVLRTGNKALAALTLVLDAGKGALAVLVGWRFGNEMAAVAALFAFLGHLFPVWLGFRGGKGVATGIGILLAYAWPVGLLAIAAWLLVAFGTRYSSLAALVAAALAPVFAWLILGQTLPIAVVLILALLVIARHAGNIARLARGEETKIRLGSGG
jgi:acyl phosphate:glycerol-3-phosphate acyltransferase